MDVTKSMEERHAGFSRATAADRIDPPSVYGGEMFVKNVAWTMAAVTLCGVALLIAWLVVPMMRQPREEQWKQEFAGAERARESGDRYRALEMYIHSARTAASIDDWRGELAIACGLQKLAKTEGPNLYGFNVIVSAMGAAERQKSAEGMKAVADAFASLGDAYASFALSRIGGDWQNTEPDGQLVVKQRTFADGIKSPAC